MRPAQDALFDASQTTELTQASVVYNAKKVNLRDRAVSITQLTGQDIKLIV